MPKLKGRHISKKEAVDDINKYLEFRDIAHQKIIDMLGNNLETSSNAGLKQYYQDDENSFFFNLELLEDLIVKGKAWGADCMRIYYGAAVKPTDPDSLRLFTELGIQEGSSTLVLLPCKITTDLSGEITKVVNVINAGDPGPGGQWPGGSTMQPGGRVGDDGFDETTFQNITAIPASILLL